MNNETALATEGTFSAEDITAALQSAGAIDEEQERVERVKVDGSTFVATDDNIWVSNPKTQEPAFVGRIMGPPSQFQAFWFTPELAAQAGRDDMATGGFCKSYYDNPAEAREHGTNGASCRACLFNPFGDSRPKCGWKGDIQFQVVPEDGTLTGEETAYTLTLSTTGMIQWKGTRKAPNEGSVTKKNFMFGLAELALQHQTEWGLGPQEAIRVALNALAEGLVAASFRIVRATNENNGQTWSVPVIEPVHIEVPDAKPAIEAGTEDSTGESLDSLDF
jgi:hypothetical protein